MQVDVDRWQFTSSLMGSLPAAYWQLTGNVLAAFGQLIGSLLAAYWQLTGNSRAAYWQITSQTGTEWMASTTPQMLTPHRTKRCKNKAKQSYANQTRTCHGTNTSIIRRHSIRPPANEPPCPTYQPRRVNVARVVLQTSHPLR